MLKLRGVAAKKPPERLRVLERQDLWHAAAQILLEVGTVPADGGGCAGHGEAVFAKEVREPRSLWVAGHGRVWGQYLAVYILWKPTRVKGRCMETTGRKNAAGGWLRVEFLRRIASAGMLWMGVAGFGIGFMVRGLPVFDGSAGILVSWGILGVMIVAFGAFYAFCRRVDASWGRGLEAELQVGDLIEHGAAQRGCAFAHDVREALGGRGNVDHVVMTPAGIWVVETKSTG